MSLLLGLLLFAAPARAADPPSITGGAVSTKDTELARRMKEALKDDPEVARTLAERILRSSLADQFIEEGAPGKSEEAQREAALEDVRKWILENPADAAFLAVGFAKDDREGGHRFEQSLSQRVERFFELNPDRGKGILGRLDRLGSESQILAKQMDMDEDERRELLQRMFEGSAQTQAKVSAKSGPGGSKGAPEAPSKGASYAGDALYDRLSAGNPTGYSPQVQQLQSELNASRAPGAPRLIETGKLDYPTLRHPYHALAYDAERLDSAFRAQRAFAQARSLKLEGSYSQAQYSDPAVQKQLDEKAGGKTPAGFEKRRAAVEAAARAVAAFDAEAARTKDPKAITARTLKALSLKRRDAARRIAAAALEGEAARLELFKGFLTPPLVEAVRRAAPDKESGALYLQRGAELEAKLDLAIARARKAIALLEKDAEPETLAQADPLMREAQRLAKTLPADVALFMDAPGRLASAPEGRGLQARLEALAARWLPSTSFGRKALEKRRARQEALDAFLRVARVGFP